MSGYNLKENGLLHNSSFMQFLISQGISNIGDSFRFIALTIVLLKLTGSGMSASLGVLFSVIPSLILSPFAGTIGDLLPAKHIMALLDFIRGLVTFLFINCTDVKFVFLLVIVISSIDTIYNPLRRKLIVSLAGKDGILNANSLLMGVSGAVFLVGPMLAGILTDKYGPSSGFMTAGITFIATSFLILFIRMPRQKKVLLLEKSRTSLVQEMYKGFDYVRKNSTLLELTIIFIITAMCSVSMNMAFYPYSFDVLGLTAKGWSLLISVYYGTNLLAAFLLYKPLKKVSQKPWATIYTGLVITALIWQVYNITREFAMVLVLQFIEGTVLAICGILIATLLQKFTQENYMARVAGINDIGASIGKIVGMAATFAIMSKDSYRIIFSASSLILLTFILIANVFKKRPAECKL